MLLSLTAHPGAHEFFIQADEEDYQAVLQFLETDEMDQEDCWDDLNAGYSYWDPVEENDFDHPMHREQYPEMYDDED
jgi:hypothetical protein